MSLTSARGLTFEIGFPTVGSAGEYSSSLWKDPLYGIITASLIHSRTHVICSSVAVATSCQLLLWDLQFVWVFGV